MYTPTKSNSSSIKANSPGDLRLSDLDLSSSFDKTQKSLQLLMSNHQMNELEFTTNMRRTNQQIDEVRVDLQGLMTKAQAYCNNSGIASGSAILPSQAPRYSGKHKASRASYSQSAVVNPDGTFFHSAPNRMSHFNNSF